MTGKRRTRRRRKKQKKPQNVNTGFSFFLRVQYAPTERLVVGREGASGNLEGARGGSSPPADGDSPPRKLSQSCKQLLAEIV